MRGIKWMDQEGGGGQRVRIPTGKSQVIWASIGQKQLDPHWIKVGPPPPWKMFHPHWNLGKMIVFFESNHWTSVK